jgi:hypothetical protein
MTASLRTERGWLRAALYVLLFLAVGYHILWICMRGSMGFQPYYPGAPNFGGPPWLADNVFGQIFQWFLVFFASIVGPPPTDTIIAVVCLAGLAASCDRQPRRETVLANSAPGPSEPTAQIE